MRSFLAAVLFVGLLGLALGAASDLELLRRILASLKEKKTLERTDDEVDLERKNSYGIKWTAGNKRVLDIYLQKSTDCKDPCKFEISFQDESGKSVGNTLYADFNAREGGHVKFTESEIMDPVVIDGKNDKDKADGNDANAIGGNRSRLPDHLLVRVCRLEKFGEKACNKRPVDISQDSDAVFFKTVKDDA